MTAVPAVPGAPVKLICDGCGCVGSVEGCGLHDAEVVYVPIASIGWTGSVFARGPHRCGTCTINGGTGDGRRSRPAAFPADAAGRVSLETRPALALVGVTGDIDSQMICELRTALDRAIAARSTVVVDLSKLCRIDSAALGVLVHAHNAARRRGGDLALAAPSRFVRMVLRTMHLQRALPTTDTVRQALTAAGR